MMLRSELTHDDVIPVSLSSALMSMLNCTLKVTSITEGAVMVGRVFPDVLKKTIMHRYTCIVHVDIMHEVFLA